MTEPLTPQSKTKPVLLSLLTLLSGIAIGVGATLIVVKQEKPDTSAKSPEWMTERMVMHIVRELKLPEEKEDELKPIIQKHMTAISVIREEARPKISAIIGEMNTEILETLDEEQKKAWEEIIERMKKRFEEIQKHRKGRGRPDGRGPGGRDGRGGPEGQRRGRDGEYREGPRRGDGPDGQRRQRQWQGDGPRDPNSPHFRRRPIEGPPPAKPEPQPETPPSEQD